MADVVFVPNVAGQQRAFRSLNGMVGQHIRVTTLRAHAISSLEAPAPGRPPRNRTGINYSTGELAFAGLTTSFGHRGKEVEGRVIAIPKHSLFLHEGTSPHIIVPKRHTYLKFHWKKVGATVFTKKVFHPGTQANDFMVRALKKVVRT